ncbi:MAG TPA: DUF4337 family protein [Steroidobacteraceae bacterium]|jgi:hypothetical protein
MAEVEIHTEHEHAADPFGRRVGVMVGIIGIILAVVTIASHRAHTATVIAKTEANDQWTFYQAKKIREHLLDVAAGLAGAFGAERDNVRELVQGYLRDRDRYKNEAIAIETDAHAKEAQSATEERRALWLDVGEGLLELGLVLSSLYFLSKRRFFPLLGAIAAIAGTAIGAASLLLR